MKLGVEALKAIDNNYFNYLKESGEKLLNKDEIKFIGNAIKEKKGLLDIFKK